MMTKQISKREWERLSAYLDQQLSAKEITGLETRLQTDTTLAAALQELQIIRGAMKQLPRLQAPRNFTLTPQMVGVQKPLKFRWYPVLRFASVLTSLLFVVIVMGDLFGVGTLMSKQEMVAPAMAPAAEYQVEEFGEVDRISDDELPVSEIEIMVSEPDVDTVLESALAEKASGNVSEEPVVGLAEPAPMSEETEDQAYEMSPAEPEAAEPAPVIEEAEGQVREISPTVPVVAEAPPVAEELESLAVEISPEESTDTFAGEALLADNAKVHLEDEGIAPTDEPSAILWLPILEIILGVLAVVTTFFAIYLHKRES